MSLSRRFSVASCRRVVLGGAVAALVAVVLPATDGVLRAQGQTGLLPGRNVNMVSGTQWPTGDPYLQRQNEPSIAASTRNPLHLLAGANDYRTVDVPFVDGAQETGDAWLGLFMSFDGGQRWQSTLMPGYPQDTSAEGAASPLRGYQAGADPVVRAGTNGLFYYAGLVFDRVEGGKNAIFVSRFIDNNNQEGSFREAGFESRNNPVKYLGASIVAQSDGATFLDKPWMAVDIPRAGARVCTIETNDASGPTRQQIRAGRLYVAYTAFTEDGQGPKSQIYLTRSDDCGRTWLPAIRISNAADRLNQGATIAIDPVTGVVYVAWRRFSASASDLGDGFLVAKSTDFGRRFSTPGIARALSSGRGKKRGLDYARYFEHRIKKRGKGNSTGQASTGNPTEIGLETNEFDQATSDINGLIAFRTNMYPTMTVDGNGRVYLAWSERGYAQVQGSRTDGDARIVMATSTDGRAWTAPTIVSNEGQAGHQLMPSLTFGGGKLVLIYYDLRDDLSRLASPWIDDKSAVTTAGVRRTLDLRASWGAPGATPAFAPSFRVSDYLFELGPGGATRQLQYNPPNLPMFAQGTAPFMGDYVDVTVAPVFVPTADGGWTYNLNGPKPVFHAVWTDNRDVRQPQDLNGDGNPWNDYTPPTALTNRTTSRFDPTQGLAVCDPANTGSRNQNIYTARLTTGLVAGSPGNSKPLSSSFQRAFVVFAQNTTNLTKAFRLTIQNQPEGGRASFDQFNPAVTSVDVTTPYRSTASRTVYATSTNPDASIRVSVVEIPYAGAPAPTANGLSDVVLINPDIANPDIANPDIANPDIANPDIANAEVYNPDIANPDIANPDIANPDIANPDIANPDIANPDIANPDIANPDIANPDIANPDIANVEVANPDIANPDIANPDIANPDIANPDIANPDIANPDIANPDIANSSLTDVTWTMTNTGNTTAAYNVNLFLAQQTQKLCDAGQNPDTTGCIATQLILRKVYTTPTAIDCRLMVETRNVLVANIRNPRFVTPGTSVSEPNDPSAENATLWLAPGETGKITLRVYDPDRYDNIDPPDDRPETKTDPDNYVIDPLFLPTTTTSLGLVTPVVQQQSVDTADVQNVPPGAAPPEAPLVTPLTVSVPPAQASTPVTLSYVAGAGPSNTNVGVAMTPALQVEVRDQYGALMPNATVTLFLAANPGNASLGGATAVTGPTGVAVFPSVTVSAAGVGFTLAATSGTALPAVSDPFTVQGAGCDPLVVTSTADTGVCGELRSAISAANANGGTIRFEVAAATPHVFAPTTPYPAVTRDGVIIDGTTDPDYALSGGQPVIQISGANMPAGSIGLALTGTGSTVRGIEFNGFAAGTSFTGAGVLLAGGGGHTVQSSHFGMLGPNYTGIHVTSSNNSVGGTAPGAGNVVGGSGQEQGIWIQSGADNRVAGNFVGNNGVSALGNNVGVRLTGGTNTVVGGATAGARNVISGNSTGVLVIGTTGTDIRGNFIGTSADGQSDVANTGNGITMYAGTTDAVIRGNLISGNGGWGVDLQHSGGLGQVTGTDIFGNTIGLALSGQALANGLGGVRIQNAPDTAVGAPPVTEGEPSRGNVISGNGGHAILVLEEGSGVTIQANRIGTNPDGDSARPNGPIGGDEAAVRIETGVSGVQIGGDATLGEGNLISGNSAYGIKIWGTANSVFGNLIGTNAAGTAALPNAKFGIHVEIGPNNVIGGSAPEQRNVISGNGLSGIALTGQGAYAGATGTQVTGNYIGLNAAGTGTIPNLGAGVDVREGAAGVITGNAISGNAGGGVAVWQGATGTTIAGNSIFENSGLGIDLDPLGVATGAPVLSNVTTAGFDYSIPSGAGTVEVFTSPACDPSGYGEGRMSIGTFTGSVTGTISTALTAGSYVTITATRAAGTSEFSNCVQVRATPTVTWTTPAAVAVGTPLGPFELKATTLISGTIVYTPPAGTLLPVGSHTLSATFTPTDTATYDSVTVTTTLVVVGPDPGHVLVPAVAGGLSNTNCQPSCAAFASGSGGTAAVSTGISFAVGQSVTLTATGQIFPNGEGNGLNGPGGVAGTDWAISYFLAPALPRFSLVGRIGTGAWQLVGPGPTTLTASGSGGQLQLAINDSLYSDNSGWFDVAITSTTLSVPGTAGGTVRAATWPGQDCPSCGPGGPGGTAPVDSGLSLELNEVVTVSATGVVGYCDPWGCGAGPDGAEIGRTENLVPVPSWYAPTASLFARVGGGGWQFVGSGPTQIVAYQAGTLEFAVNDSNYADNSGGWTVTIARPGLPTATVTPVAPFSAVHNGTPKSLAFTTSPGGLGLDVRYNGGGAPSDIGAYFVRAKVTGGVRAGAGAAIFTIGSTLAIGGGGGGPYDRTCGPGVFATGFDANNMSSYGLWNARLRCEGGGTTERFVLDNDNFNAYPASILTSACPAGQVMVGFHGYQGLSDGTAGPFVKALGARCQDASGVGPVTSIPVVGNTNQTYVGPYDCPAGQAVTGVVGGAGGVLDSTALVCSAIPGTITAVSPQPAGVAFAQAVTVVGTGLPFSSDLPGTYPPAIAQQVVIRQGSVDYPAVEVHLATASKWILMLPQALAPGAATIRLTNADGTTTTNTFGITVSSTPSAPVIHHIFQASGSAGFTTTPVTSLTPGAWLTVEADGISMSGYLATYVFTPTNGSPARTAAGNSANVGGISGGIRHTVQIPVDLDVTAAVDVQVYLFGPSPYSNAVRFNAGPTITSATPSSMKAGEGFIVLRGTDLPIGTATFGSGTWTGTGFVFTSPSSSNAVFVRLPAGMPLGSGTVTLSNGSAVTNAFSVNVTPAPGTPVITRVYSSTWPADPVEPFESVSANQSIFVSVDGIDTTGVVLEFVQGSNVWTVNDPTIGSNSDVGMVATVTVPGGVVAGTELTIRVRQGSGAFSSPYSLTVGSSPHPDPQS